MARLPAVTPHRRVVQRFKELGWSGPDGGGRHLFMWNGHRRVTIPNRHGAGDVDRHLLSRVLDQAGVSVDDWLGDT